MRPRGRAVTASVVLASIAALSLFFFVAKLPDLRLGDPDPVGVSKPLSSSTIRKDLPPNVDASRVAEATPADIPLALNNDDMGCLVVRVLWSDGSPAVGVGVKTLRATERIDIQQFQPTDSDGTCVFMDLAAGEGYALLDRGIQSTFSIEPGLRTELTIRIPDAIEIAGTVVNHDGEPVGGAEIWLCRPWDFATGFCVAESSHDGAFHVRDVQDTTMAIAARATSHSPSPFVVLSNRPAALLLTLGGPAGSVAGRVVSIEHGAPISDAIVCVGHGSAEAVVPDQGDPVYHSAHFTTRTDLHGLFLIDGCPGSTDIRISAPGFSPAQIPINVVPTGVSKCDVRLSLGSTLRGVVLSDDGEPISGAAICLSEAGLFHTIWRASSDDEGGFVLRDLPVHIAVVVEATSRSGAQSQVVRVEPGQEVSCVFKLTTRRTIVGTLLRLDGAPAAGWKVCAIAPGAAYAATTQSDGTFVFPSCEEGRYSLRAYAPEYPEFAAGLLPDVEPGNGHTRFQVAKDLASTACIMGQVRDELERPLRVEVILTNDFLSEGTKTVTDESGHFSSGPLPSGSWTVQIFAYDGRSHECVVSLEPYSKVDLGIFRLSKQSTRRQ